jgi:glycosyltransferase involved in cell wall biosynthesis
MNVLVLAREFPRPPYNGATQRILHFVRGLARRHRVMVLALAREGVPAADLENLQRESGCARVETFDGADMPAPDQVGVWARPDVFVRRLLTSRFPNYVHDVWSRSLVSRLTQLRADGEFDFVVARDPSFAEQARSAGFRHIILDSDDLFGVLLWHEARSRGLYKRMPLHLLNAVKARLYERTLPRRFDRVTIAKSDDRRFFPRRMRGGLAVIPNGVRVPPAVDPSCEQPNRLLIVGTLAYPPNQDAVGFFAREVLPLLWAARPDVTLDVVGRGPAPRDVVDALQDRRCRLHESPIDLTPFYSEAALVVAPVRRGLGTRIKVIEALAQEKALVATSFAPAGLGLESGKHYVAADSACDLARACAELLANPQRRRTLATAGRAYVVEHFDWNRIEESIADLVPSGK